MESEIKLLKGWMWKEAPYETRQLALELAIDIDKTGLPAAIIIFSLCKDLDWMRKRYTELNPDIKHVEITPCVKVEFIPHFQYEHKYVTLLLAW